MDYQQPGASTMNTMTRYEIYLLMEGRTIDKKLNNMEQKLLCLYEDDDTKNDVKHKLSMFKYQFEKRWQAAHKTRAVFEKNNKDWLNGTVVLPATVTCPDKTGSIPDDSISSEDITPQKRGRPQKIFTQSSERTKRRKTKDLRSNELAELTYATQMKLRESGKAVASKILKDLQKSPTRAKKYKAAYKRSSEEPPRQLSALKALSMIADAGLSREQYEIVRKTNKSFYPCYTILQKAKKEIYPPQEAYRVTATYAEIELQHLLDKTASRLMQYLGEDILNNLSEEEKRSLLLISKWGCDGTTQPQFKMRFDNDTDSDANLFQSSMVPLQLFCEKSKKVIWQNDTPSSPRFCRPIRMRFVHETTDITKEEISYIKHKINNLTPTKYNNAHVKHKMVLTMVDGKVCNAATHTKSTMKCYLCDATSNEFNDLSKTKPVKKEYLAFGLSLLHARIRFFETMLHVAYKLPVQKWNKRLTEEEKNVVKKTKLEIQNKFKMEMGLRVDMPKANFGTTNDGNTSRRFFEQYETSAAITGLDPSLLFRLKTILDALCSGLPINIDKFKQYAKDTEELYVSLYRFYPQSPTMHKILRHGAEVIKDAILPIGQLSQEAPEARNKHIREYRLNMSRKFSREECNMDILNRLLLTSDPLLSGIRSRKRKNLKAYTSEVLDLLLPVEASTECSESENENED